MNNCITINDLKRLIPRVKIIDIRDNYQHNLGHIPTAINIPMNFLIMNPENYMSKEETYYICCEYGCRSSSCVANLSKKGYKVIDVLGGYNEYKLNNHLT